MPILIPESSIPSREKSLLDAERMEGIMRAVRARKAREAAHDRGEHAERDLRCHVCDEEARAKQARVRLNRAADEFLRAHGYTVSRHKAWQR